MAEVYQIARMLQSQMWHSASKQEYVCRVQRLAHLGDFHVLLMSGHRGVQVLQPFRRLHWRERPSIATVTVRAQHAGAAGLVYEALNTSGKHAF